MIENYFSHFESVRIMAADIILHSADQLTIDTSIISGLLKQELKTFQTHRTENLLSTPSLSWECELGLSLFFNSVNFCYREPSSGKEYCYTTRDGQPLKRTAAFFTALSKSGLDWNDLNQVAALSPASWLELTQLGENNTLYLGLERRERIVGLANFLIGKGIKTVLNLIEIEDFNSLKLIRVFIESSFFKDEFLKRAQVALKMMDAVLDVRNGRGLKGIGLLTCMADYRIPQVFYNLGAVKLSADLEGHLTCLEPVLSGSRAELALRATVIVIGLQLAELIGVNEAEVDTLLWEYSQKMDKAGQMKIPHMLVATDKY